MNVSDLAPRPTACEPFRRDAAKSIPSASGCYVLTTVTGHILYMGLASTLSHRFEQHLDTPAKVAVTPEGRAVLFHWFETVDLESVERGWLNAHQVLEARLPILNVLNSPISC